MAVAAVHDMPLSVTPHTLGRQASLDQSEMLRLMVWNIETSGGGIRHGPTRPDWVIQAIARVIATVRPHVCGVLEVMDGKRFFRKKKDKANNAKKKQKTGPPHPGLAQIELIVVALNNMTRADGITWTSYPNTTSGPPGGYDHSETCAFIFQQDSAITLTSAAYITQDGSGDSLSFPTQKFRRPLAGLFRFSGRLARRNGSAWTLPFCAFHAPSPTHPERFKAILNLARTPFVEDVKYPEFVVGVDSNIDPEASAYTRWEQATTFMDIKFDEKLEELGIQRWTGEDTGRSSLRRGVVAHPRDRYLGDRKDEPVEQSTEDLGNAAYDKLWLFSRDRDDGSDLSDDAVLRNPEVRVFDTVAACLSPSSSTVSTFSSSTSSSSTSSSSLSFSTSSSPSISLPSRSRPLDSDITSCLWDRVRDQSSSSFGTALSVANQISDHKPLFMTADIDGINQLDLSRPSRHYRTDFFIGQRSTAGDRGLWTVGEAEANHNCFYDSIAQHLTAYGIQADWRCLPAGRACRRGSGRRLQRRRALP